MMRKIFRGETADVFPGVAARNKAVLDYEHFIHRTFYPYVIHPHSRFKVYWDLFIISAYPVKLTVFFFVWAFLKHTNAFYLSWMFLMKLVNLINLILTFFMGYVENRTEIIVLKPKKIALKYLGGTFVLDVLSCFPYEICMYLVRPQCISVSVLMIRDKCQLFEFFTAFSVICEMGTFIRCYRNTAKVLFWNPYLHNIFCFTYFCLIMIIFNFTFLFALAFTYKGLQPNTLKEEFQYFVTVLINFAFDVLFLNTNFPGLESSVQIPVLLFTFFCSIALTSYFVKYATGKMKARERFFFIQSRVKSFAKMKNLPVALRQKTQLYFEILLQNTYHTDDEVFDYVPNSLKADMSFHFTLPLLKGFYAFEDLPTYVLRQLAECLQHQLHLPNELVMSKNEVNLYMYFIQRGTVAFYSSQQSELYHFEAGSSINGRHFIEGKAPSNNVAISTEVTEVWRLEYEDFMDIMDAFPKFLAHMKEKLSTRKRESHDFIETAFDA